MAKKVVYKAEQEGGLEARVAELEHDVKALAELLGRQFGEPMASLAKEIVSKRQAH